MRKTFPLLLLLPVLISCGDQGVKLGSAKYHPSFLWSKADTIPVEKIVQLDFSADAVADPTRYAEFELVDMAGQRIGQDIVVMSVDGMRTNDNVFRVTSQDSIKRLSLLFMPEAKGGTYQGFLRLRGHNLDRLGNQELATAGVADAFKWSVGFEKEMNPYVKALIWIIIVIFALLLLWFLILRPLIYPHFPKMRKTMLIKENDRMAKQVRLVFSGKRAVVISSEKIKQSLWQRIFVGEVYVKLDPRFTTPLVFRPCGKNAIATGIGYQVSPNPIPRSGVATISNQQLQLDITLN